MVTCRQIRLLLLALAVWHVMAEAPAQPAAGGPGRGGESRPGRAWIGGARRGGALRDGATSTPMGAMRQFMAGELRNVPEIQDTVQEILQLQQERAGLMRDRQQLAAGTDRPSDAMLRDFHKLLVKDDKISSRLQELQARIAEDAPQLRKKMAARRHKLEKQLEELRGKTSDRDGAGAGEDVQQLARSIRMYEFLEERVATLEDDPEQPDWARNLVRGGWMAEGMDVRIKDQLRKRLADLAHEQADLRRRINQLSAQLAELQELLDSPPAARGRKAAGEARRR